MKKLILIILLSISIGAFSQTIQFSVIQNKTTIPRVSWCLGDYNDINEHFYWGMFLCNQGAIWKDSTDKIKYRVIALSPSLLYKYKIAFVGGGCDINLHEKTKVFPDGLRKDKQKTSSWGVKHLLLPYISAGITIKDYTFYTDIYLQKIDNIEMFNIGINYNFFNDKLKNKLKK
jgi:hypothetical protein